MLIVVQEKCVTLMTHQIATPFQGIGGGGLHLLKEKMKEIDFDQPFNEAAARVQQKSVE